MYRLVNFPICDVHFHVYLCCCNFLVFSGPAWDLTFEPVQQEEDSFESLKSTKPAWNCDTKWKSITHLLKVVHFNSFSKYRSNFWMMSGWAFTTTVFYNSFRRCKSVQPELWQCIPIPTSFIVTGLVLANPMMIWFKELNHPKADSTCNLLGSPDQLTGGPDKWLCWCKGKMTGQCQHWLK